MTMSSQEGKGPYKPNSDLGHQGKPGLRYHETLGKRQSTSSEEKEYFILPGLLQDPWELAHQSLTRDKEGLSARRENQWLTKNLETKLWAYPLVFEGSTEILVLPHQRAKSKRHQDNWAEGNSLSRHQVICMFIMTKWQQNSWKYVVITQPVYWDGFVMEEVKPSEERTLCLMWTKVPCSSCQLCSPSWICPSSFLHTFLDLCYLGTNKKCQMWNEVCSCLIFGYHLHPGFLTDRRVCLPMPQSGSCFISPVHFPVWSDIDIQVYADLAFLQGNNMPFNATLGP